MAKVLAFNVSKEKGIPKEEMDMVTFLEDSGIEGDAHAAPGLRQVSLLSGECADKMRAVMPEVANGCFTENITTEGLSLSDLSIGDVILLDGQVLLQVTRVGKKCFGVCGNRDMERDCVMPREGIFARVLRGGTVSAGCPMTIITFNEDAI